MPGRKRNRAEMEASATPEVPGTIRQLRNMWEFANLMQYIFIFGKAVKIDDNFDIEDLENECLKPGASQMLSDIGLALLKVVSSHRGLTHEIFDEYTRRQYVAKAPKRNPFGTAETPKKFDEFDIFMKIRVLFQLTQWTFTNPDRVRERMPEVKDIDQTSWRIEEVGYDRQERLYFVLDDNRLYRRTDPALPPPPPKPKAKTKSRRSRGGTRSSKRKRASTKDDPIKGEDEDEETLEKLEEEGKDDDMFGGRKWECLAVTLDEYKDFLESIRKSRDPDEKFLYQRLTEEVLPTIEKIEEARKKKLAKHEKELVVLEKLAHAKRSSRIAQRAEKEREEHQHEEEERKRQAESIAVKKEEQKHTKQEAAREARLVGREQRMKERELKRIQREQELAELSEDSKKIENGESRKSERRIQSEIDKRKKELEELKDDDEWTFDCSVCGVYGENLDDGSLSIACEKCNVWQHSACHGISKDQAEKDDFHFICDDCKHKMEDAKKPKIKLRIGPGSSPPDQKLATNGDASQGKRHGLHELGEGAKLPPMKKFKPIIKTTARVPGQHNFTQNVMNAPTLNPSAQRQFSFPYGNADSVSSPQRAPPSKTNRPGRPSQPISPHSSLGPNGLSRPSQLSSPISPTKTLFPPFQTPRPSTAPQGDNPFLNTFDRQRPMSSQSMASVRSFPSPVVNRPSMSPTQGNKEVGPILFPPTNQPTFSRHSMGGFVPSDAQTPGTNHHDSPYSLPPASPPKASPMQPHSTAYIHSSPSSAGPHATPSHPSSGISPTKHSPPRTSERETHSISSTPVLPPATNLSPSPRAQMSWLIPEKGGRAKMEAAARMHNQMQPPFQVDLQPKSPSQPTNGILEKKEARAEVDPPKSTEDK
ncbi:MAG: hypothetical protein M1834_008143 [Cirrosporium novae-zelandiae]|nr:MAG: hypothetical protein M1834_008143 [Cirrosporium novae-zelandiae]